LAKVPVAVCHDRGFLGSSSPGPGSAAGGSQRVIAARRRRAVEAISVTLQAFQAFSFGRYAAVCIAR